MELKAENPVGLLDGHDVSPLIRAYFELCQLKQLFRQGWLKNGVPRQRCESVADHSLGVALLAMWIAEAEFPELDVTQVLLLALVHEFGEIYAGDITPNDGISADEKRERETQSVQRVFGKLPGGERYIALWQEFEQGDSPEAHFVRQVDRLEMGLQAGVYRLQGLGDMQQFFTSARQALEDVQLQRLVDIVSAL